MDHRVQVGITGMSDCLLELRNSYLDGQQRMMTTLYGVIRGKPPAFSDAASSDKERPYVAGLRVPSWRISWIWRVTMPAGTMQCRELTLDSAGDESRS